MGNTQLMYKILQASQIPPINFEHDERMNIYEDLPP